jgi:hypothetical protein
LHDARFDVVAPGECEQALARDRTFEARHRLGDEQRLLVPILAQEGGHATPAEHFHAREYSEA